MWYLIFIYLDYYTGHLTQLGQNKLGLMRISDFFLNYQPRSIYSDKVNTKVRKDSGFKIQNSFRKDNKTENSKLDYL